MVEILIATGDAAEELNKKIHLILDAATPPFQEETDINVQVNAIAMLMALVLQRVRPEQHDELLKVFEEVTKVHYDAMNQAIARRMAAMFFDLVRGAFSGRKPDDETTH